MVAQHATGGSDVAAGVGVAPDGDAFDAGGGELLRRRFDIPRFGGDRVDTEPVEVGERSSRHDVSF